MSKAAIVAVLFMPAALAAQSFTSLSPAAQPFVSVSDARVALTHVRVVDGTGKPPLEDQTIVIEDGKITAVTAAGNAKVPANARTIDLTGHTVIPGLIGMHDHTFYTT